MPTSAWDGRKWVTDRIADVTSETVIDIGAGEGTYSILGRHLAWSSRWVAVEIHEPYVERFLLGTKYDDVIVTDARTYRPMHLEGGYTVLLGDVLEHMQRHEAVAILNHHLDYADEIMVSVPIVYAPQDACFGNDHEAHVYHWHYDEMLNLLPGCEAFKGTEVGRFWWRRDG